MKKCSVMSCGIYDFAWDKQPEHGAREALERASRDLGVKVCWFYFSKSSSEEWWFWGASTSALQAEQNRESVVAAMSWSLRFLRISLFNTSNMLRSKPSASSAGRTIWQSVRSQARLPYLLLGHDVSWFQYFLVESWFASPAFVVCAWPKAPRWFPPTIEKKSQLFAVPWSWTDNFDFVVIFAPTVFINASCAIYIRCYENTLHLSPHKLVFFCTWLHKKNVVIPTTTNTLSRTILFSANRTLCIFATTNYHSVCFVIHSLHCPVIFSSKYNFEKYIHLLFDHIVSEFCHGQGAGFCPSAGENNGTKRCHQSESWLVWERMASLDRDKSLLIAIVHCLFNWLSLLVGT